MSLGATHVSPAETRRPANPIMIAPSLSRSLFGTKSSGSELFVSPTSFGAREPTLPTARTITLARIATAEGVDKRYERAWLKGLQDAFAAHSSCKDTGGSGMRLVKRGDVFSVPIWKDRPIAADETPGNDESASGSGSDSDDSWSASTTRKTPTALAYFIVASLSYDPLNPLDEDFRSSTSSKARAGELGCWVDVGPQGATRMVLTGVERALVGRRAAEKVWRGLSESLLAITQLGADQQRPRPTRSTWRRRADYAACCRLVWQIAPSAVLCKCLS